jgi:hypothetical protein
MRTLFLRNKQGSGRRFCPFPNPENCFLSFPVPWPLLSYSKEKSRNITSWVPLPTEKIEGQLDYWQGGDEIELDLFAHDDHRDRSLEVDPGLLEFLACLPRYDVRQLADGIDHVGIDGCRFVSDEGLVNEQRPLVLKAYRDRPLPVPTRPIMPVTSPEVVRLVLISGLL